MARRADDNGPLLVTVVFAAATTAAVAGIPFLRFAYDNPSLHVALETGEGLIAVLLGFLAVGRFRTSGKPADLVLGASFAVLAVTSLLLSVGPNVAARDRAVGFSVWAAAGLRLAGATGIATEAVLGRRDAPSPRARAFVLTCAATVAGIVLLAVLADQRLAPPIDPTVEATASNRPTLIGHPLLLAVQVAGFVMFAVAAVGFASRPHRRPLDTWLAAGCILAASSRVHYFLFSSLYTSWVSTGDVLRLGSYLAFLAGAATEIQAYWRAQAALAAAEERRRIARDLHDGLAQELSFIRSQTIGATTWHDAQVGMVAEAAGRALLESRRLIRVLGAERAPIDEDLQDALAPVTRVGVEAGVDVTGPGAAALSPTQQSALVGIAREASGNAARHGRPKRIDVRLTIGPAATTGCLEVIDDGCGLDITLPTDGFGLGGMRDRARTIGATLDVRSTPGIGTRVTARW